MIAIDKKYYLDIDDYQFILKVKDGKNKDGEDIYTNVAFFGTLEGLLRGYSKRITKKTHPKTYDELLDILSKIDKTIVKFGKKITFEDILNEYLKKKYREKEIIQKRTENKKK